MVKSLTTRKILIIATTLLLIGAGCYKYYEWSTLQSLSALYNKSWTQELDLVQNENKNYIPFTSLYKKVFDKNAGKDSLLNSYSELTGDLQLVLSARENYLSTLQSNYDTYSGINTSFLLGERGHFAQQLVSNQKKYYAIELNNMRIGEASLWLQYNILTSWKDMAIIGNFSSKINSDPQTSIPKYFSDLSPLEKYTESDFTFEHENEIKQYYPKGDAALNKYKDYFSSIYTTGQNETSGDYQSAVYTFSSLKDSSANLNFSLSDSIQQEDNYYNTNSNNSIQIITDQSDSIKKFKSQGLNQYPLLPKVGDMKVDLVLCQLYDYKAGLYHSITTKYIASKNPTSLLNELSSIPPSTQKVDDKFDKSSMLLINDDKKIQFTCIDKSTNSKYDFVTLK